MFFQSKANCFLLPFILIYFISCSTIPKTEEQPAFINPTVEVFNPKGSNPKFNKELFMLGGDTSRKIKIKSWMIEIYNMEDQSVFTSENTGKLASSFEWNGKMLSNQIAQDGNYYAVFIINYIFGKPTIVKSKQFSIDTVPLSVDIQLSTNIFSPGKVGKKDDVTISHLNATKNADWNGFIYNNLGIKVVSFYWNGEIPKKIIWDGKDENNKILPDGTYYYQVTARDKAGNYFESEKFDTLNLAQFKNSIVIFTQDIPVSVNATLESFNPESINPKYNHQAFDLRVNIPKDNRISSWKFEIKNNNDQTVYLQDGKTEIKTSLDWKGQTSQNTNVPDGEYYAQLTVDFNSGTNSTGKSKIFTIDSILPAIEINPLTDIFSPNGDGNLDTFNIIQKGSKEGKWQEKITNSENKIIWEKSYEGFPIMQESWNGTDMNDNIQSNGVYTYTIQCTDKAGNTSSAQASVTLENEFTSGFISINTNQFSSKIMSLKIKPTLGFKDEIDHYQIEILNATKKTVRTFQGTSIIPEFIEWHGLTDDKNAAPDGNYTARLSVKYKFGNKIDVESSSFLLHTSPPDVKIKISPKLFSPDSDGINDKLSIDLTADDITGIKNWSVSIMEPDKKREFMIFKGNGKPMESVLWDGKNNNGELVESAEDYPVIVRVENNVGTVYEKELDPVTVDILVTRLADGRYKIKISNILFKPDSSEMIDAKKNNEIIQMLVDKLVKFPQHQITIEGYVNPFFKGHFEKEKGNKLSEERAKTVANLLDKKGISLSRMTIIGKGGKNPIVYPDDKGNVDESYLEKNRRVEFYLNR